MTFFTGEVVDVMKQNVVEPYSVKEQVINGAVEVSSMILRIDDVIASSKLPSILSLGRGVSPEGLP